MFRDVRAGLSKRVPYIHLLRCRGSACEGLLRLASMAEAGGHFFAPQNAWLAFTAGGNMGKKNHGWGSLAQRAAGVLSEVAEGKRT